jgi:hypothetical protein
MEQITKAKVKQALARLQKGQSNAEVADALGLSQVSVRHIRRVHGLMPGSKYLKEARAFFERHGLEVPRKKS